MPEMFLNVNKLNLGVEENGNKVNNVATPCQNNPYEFILTMKQALENDCISYSIQNWIDLIFGIKSKGKEAEMAYNLFTEASYQEDVNINSKEDKESFLRRVEFGLIPNQILTKEFNRREKKEEFYKDDSYQKQALFGIIQGSVFEDLRKEKGNICINIFRNNFLFVEN